MSFDPYRLARAIFFAMDGEFSHDFTTAFLKRGIAPCFRNDKQPSLRTRVCGLDFPNPIGLAAGFDKNGTMIGPMLGFGFGFVETGTITPKPQPGNPKPRMFRAVADEALINRFGFNSDGIAACLPRFAAYRSKPARKGIVGINIGKNKETADAAADYKQGIAAFAPFADYLAVNISSPNTPGLRDLQNKEALAELLRQVMETRNSGAKKPPVFVKIAPDQTDAQMNDIAETSLAAGIDGIIIGNTTVSRPASLPPALAAEAGGLSGKPLRDMSTRVLTSMYKLTGGKLPLIGCGGVSSGADAYAKIRAGASLVQIYTALIYEGPFLIPRVCRDLSALLKRDGFAHVADAVGADHQ